MNVAHVAAPQFCYCAVGCSNQSRLLVCVEKCVSDEDQSKHLLFQLDTLEYIHSREYIHADIKAQNLLLGYKRGTENQVRHSSGCWPYPCVQVPTIRTHIH